MRWFRTSKRSIHVLVMAFLLAQFAGSVSSPLTGAWASEPRAASHVHHHHAGTGDIGGMGNEHGDTQQGHSDYCCALHAFFAGVLPSVAAVGSMTLTGERVAANFAQATIGLAPGRLDRPPKPLL